MALEKTDDLTLNHWDAVAYRCITDSANRNVAELTIETVRGDLSLATTRQRQAMDLVEHRGDFCPQLFHEIKDLGLLPLCTLVADDGAAVPMKFRHISSGKVAVFGRQWAVAHLGQPVDKPGNEFFHRTVGQLFLNADQSIGPTLNLVVVRKNHTTVIGYTHVLFAFASEGRRAVLSVAELAGEM